MESSTYLTTSMRRDGCALEDTKVSLSNNLVEVVLDLKDAFVAGGDLNWLDTLESEQIELVFHGESASITYQPEQAGNYLMVLFFDLKPDAEIKVTLRERYNRANGSDAAREVES